MSKAFDRLLAIIHAVVALRVYYAKGWKGCLALRSSKL